MVKAQDYLLPASGRGREYERKALRIRSFAGVATGLPLDAYRLASSLGLRLIDPQQLEGLPSEVRRQLFHRDVGSWSGSVTPILPDGTRLVILNPKQSPERRSATLMEEVCHVLLGHEADRLDYGTRGERRYDEAKESEAYGVGAAALMPYHVLGPWLEMMSRGNCNHAEAGLSDLGRKYGVSRSLVVYRLRIVGLWRQWSEINIRTVRDTGLT